MPALIPLNGTMALQENSSATGSTDYMWTGGPGVFSGTATFSSGTVTLQMLTPDNNWVAVGSDTTLSAAGAAGFILPKGTRIRAAIATATAVYAYVSPMPS